MLWKFLTWLEETDVATWIREGDFISDPFSTYYTLLGIHSVGMVMVVGIGVMLSSRLLGFQQSISLSQANQLMAVAWWGFYINLISGILLYVGQPRRELLTIVFWLKMLSIVLAVITMRSIQKALDHIEVMPRPDGTAVEVVPHRLRVQAVILTLLWLFAIVTGRLIGYTQPPPPG